MVLLRRQGYKTIKYSVYINGEESGGNDGEGNDEGGKGDRLGCAFRRISAGFRWKLA
jgi:hypothetical protein